MNTEAPQHRAKQGCRTFPAASNGARVVGTSTPRSKHAGAPIALTRRKPEATAPGGDESLAPGSLLLLPLLLRAALLTTVATLVSVVHIGGEACLTFGGGRAWRVISHKTRRQAPDRRLSASRMLFRSWPTSTPRLRQQHCVPAWMAKPAGLKTTQCYIE